MAVEGLCGRVHIVVMDAILLAGLLHNGSDLRVMGLDYTREQMVGCLVVQSTSEHGPEPTTGGIVLCRGNLKLRPK